MSKADVGWRCMPHRSHPIHTATVSDTLTATLKLNRYHWLDNMLSARAIHGTAFIPPSALSKLWPAQHRRLPCSRCLVLQQTIPRHQSGPSRQAAGSQRLHASENPWDFGFQCNERLLTWDDSAQAQLIRIWLGQQLNMNTQQVQKRLQELANLLPDMVDKLERAQAQVLFDLAKDPAWTADWLLGLRKALPRCNVSALVTAQPQLMLKFTGESLSAKLSEFAAALPGVDVEGLVEREPLLLRADIAVVLQDVRRLMPGRDPVQFLVANPGLVLDMDVSGQPSTLEHN